MLHKAQKDDWFSARWILAAAAVSVIAMIAFVWREFATREPIVDLRVLNHRSFATGTMAGLALVCIPFVAFQAGAPRREAGGGCGGVRVRNFGVAR